jgi:hypothetical protein
VKPNDGPRWLPMAQAIRDRLPGVQWLPLPGVRVGVLRMPMPENPDPMTLRQFVSRAQQAACRIEADADELAELRASAEAERSSRGMFVARLENMQTNGDPWLTVAAVLALLNDCDMLAARERA